MVVLGEVGVVGLGVWILAVCCRSFISLVVLGRCDFVCLFYLLIWFYFGLGLFCFGFDFFVGVLARCFCFIVYTLVMLGFGVLNLGFWWVLGFGVWWFYCSIGSVVG